MTELFVEYSNSLLNLLASEPYTREDKSFTVVLQPFYINQHLIRDKVNPETHHNPRFRFYLLQYIDLIVRRVIIYVLADQIGGVGGPLNLDTSFLKSEHNSIMKFIKIKEDEFKQWAQIRVYSSSHYMNYIDRFTRNSIQVVETKVSPYVLLQELIALLNKQCSVRLADHVCIILVLF